MGAYFPGEIATLKLFQATSVSGPTLPPSIYEKVYKMHTMTAKHIVNTVSHLVRPYSICDDSQGTKKQCQGVFSVGSPCMRAQQVVAGK